MKKFLLLAIVLAFPIEALSANVNTSEYRREHGQYGRSDGPHQRRDSNGFDMVINGYRQMSYGSQLVYEDFTEYGDADVVQIGAAGGCLQSDLTTTAANQGDFDICYMPSGNRLASFQSTAQTLGIDMDAGSLDLGGDQVNNEILEIMWGVPGASGAPFVIGESPAFYQCAKLTVVDVTGSDALFMGFRTLETGNADNQAYDSYSAIGSVSGDVKLETEVAGGGTTTTDTTENLADLGTDTYCIYVSAAGVVTYKIDGHAPATTAAYTWADAESVIPYIYVRQDADLTGEVDLLEWEVGYQ